MITIIDFLAPFQYIRAEEMAESIVQSNNIGEPWFVRDLDGDVEVHVFPVVGGFGLFCSQCHGFYPKEVCEHTAAAFLSAKEWIGDESDDDTKVGHIIRRNIQELKSIIVRGTEHYGCFYASKEIGGIEDMEICNMFAGSVLGRALRLLDRIHLEITRCVGSESLRESLLSEVRTLVHDDSYVFRSYVALHWDELEDEGDPALFCLRLDVNRTAPQGASRWHST